MKKKSFSKMFMDLILCCSVLIIVALMGGCKGNDGANGANGLNGTNGINGIDGADLTVGTVDASTFTFDDLRNIPLGGKILSVSTAGNQPVVTFQVVNKNTNEGIRGLRTFSLHIAQLQPEAVSGAGPGVSNSYWLNYITSSSSAGGAFRPTTDPVSQFNSTTGAMTKQGYSVVDNVDGTYTVTFASNIKSGATATWGTTYYNPASATYDATLTHRIVVGVRSVAVPGVVGKTPGAYAGPINPITGAAFAQFTNTNGVNFAFDFVPSTGTALASSARDNVTIDACNQCHYKLQYGSNNTSGHFGSRTDTKTCVMCHTPQNIVSNQSTTTNADFTPFIHKIHMGSDLPAAETQVGINLNEVTYPQDVKNCVNCHKGTDADNWKTKPTRKVCGSCHNDVDFATGVNHDGPLGTGGARADDSMCSSCHDAAAITDFHVTVDPTGSNGRGGYPLNTAQDVPTPGFPSGQGPSIALASQLGNLPAGVYKIGLEISSVTVTGASGAKKAKVVYRILKDSLPVTLNTPTTSYLIDNVDGTPSIYLAWAETQDGITAPADWNKSANVTVKALRDAQTNGTASPSQTGPDGSGYYTATLATTIPDAATMVTAALGINYNGFVQLNHASYPNGIRLREPAFPIKTATGYTPRRPIVENAKCNKCHGQLGVSPSFHSGARNNGEGCAICHTPNNATGHIGAANNYGGGWSVSAKDLIHGIHGSSKREQAYSYEATALNPGGFDEVTYPGILKNCEQCHSSNSGLNNGTTCYSGASFDFTCVTRVGSTNSTVYTTDLLNSMLFSTATNSNMFNPDPVANPSIGLSPWVTKLGGGQIDYSGRANNLVISPISAACFGCHDSMNAVNHMKLNGGVIYGHITTNETETCLVCHGPASNTAYGDYVPAIKTVHRWW